MFSSSLRNLTRTTIQRRGLASKPYFVEADAKSNVKGKLLSDPATYPLIVILGCAVSMFTGFGLFFASSASDVRLDPEKRTKLVRDWLGRDAAKKHGRVD